VSLRAGMVENATRGAGLSLSNLSDKRLFEIFHDALQLTGQERVAFLDAACQADAERSLVEGLLSADAANDQALPELAWGSESMLESVREHVPLASQEAFIGRRLGNYVLQSELGRGGMGVVYLALQDNTQRLVALKCLQPMLSDAKHVGRFEQEVNILGRLDHPGIAQIFDAGALTEGGSVVHYFAMELVQGRVLSEYAHESKLSLEEKLELVAAICSAVHHAHERGVVHRDLKPANILVTASGQPKVLDFGVSRVVDRDVQLTTLGTDAGRLIGTLSYMSPEQAGGDHREVESASDIYALGVIIFELISGELPHDLGDKTLLSAARAIRDERPKILATTVAHLPVDVGTIVGKAMELEAARRYATAEDMAKDLRRFLNHEPIHAHPPSTLYVALRFVRRHRLLAGGAAVVLTTLILATAISLYWALSAEEARADSDWSGYQMSLDLSDSDLRDGQLASAQAVLNKSPVDLRGWEWEYLAGQADQSLFKLEGHTIKVWSVALSPDGRTAYSCSGDTELRSWDMETGKCSNAKADHLDPVFCVAASSDARFVASGSRDVRLRDARSLEVVAVIEGHSGAIHGLEFSADGSLLASGDSNGKILISDGRDGRPLKELLGQGSMQWELQFSPNGERLASGSSDGALVLWDTIAGTELTRVDTGTGGVFAMDFAHDGEHIAVAGKDCALRLLDPETLVVVLKRDAHEEPIYDLVYSADGALIFTASMDRTIGIWNSDTLEPLGSWVGHLGVVDSLFIDEHTGRLLSGSWDQTLRVWDDSPSGLAKLNYPAAEIIEFSWADDENQFYTLSSAGDIELRGLDSLEVLKCAAYGPRMETVAFEFGYNGALLEWVKSNSSHPTFKGALLRQADGNELGRMEQTAHWMGFVKRGTEFWTNHSDGSVTFHDSDSGALLRTLDVQLTSVSTLDVAVDKDWLALGSSERLEPTVWDLATGRLLATLAMHSDDIEDIEFSPSSRWLVSGSEDKTAQVWRTRDWELAATLSGHDGGNVRVAFHPNEERLATVSDDGYVRIWAVGSWDQLLSIKLSGEPGDAVKIEFSSRGQELLVCMENGLYRLDGN
jgi:WD40 repeat protein/serine/threonine protein kinase